MVNQNRPLLEKAKKIMWLIRLLTPDMGGMPSRDLYPLEWFSKFIERRWAAKTRLLLVAGLSFLATAGLLLFVEPTWQWPDAWITLYKAGVIGGVVSGIITGGLAILFVFWPIKPMPLLTHSRQRRKHSKKKK